jgi:GNAT superfamily N-acetyltransferase
MNVVHQGFIISDDKALLNIEQIYVFLLNSYWAKDRTIERIVKSIENSDCYGVYEGELQIGFARVITDGATMYYLCDVYIDEKYRRFGLGKTFVEHIVNSEKYSGLTGLLGTRDAHKLYEKYGFTKNAETYMVKRSQ